ncbi:flagellin N-terminal helical domain-containing protein [Pelagibaculum spongiae]|uniref:Flagellin n=1 Tax=Pelagibaculum spongiae TaxID=2080658 RepID=A0A2V1H4Y0_9GAMM|nr:flagellin [Pelagibaculum spongiae]PVZ70696.1 flagellin [Pelagibaculum spongiae]
MAQVINTNVGSLNAQRQLNMSQKSQQTSMERLSSGLRINSAKDDAAGLAISTKFDSQVRGLEQANRNANDGISVAQTAEGSMQEMTSILQRMRELGLQSANDSNSSEERGFIQQEMDQMTEELDRISENTEFNGAKLLNSEQTKSFQIGANSGQTIDIELKDVSSKALGLTNTDAKGDLNSGRVGGGEIGAGDVNLNGVALGPIADISKNPDGTDATQGVTAKQVAADVNSKSAETGVTADAYNTVKGDKDASGVVRGLTIKVGGNNEVTINSDSKEELVTNINEKVAGVKASLSDDGELVLSNDNGDDIKIGGGVAGSGLTEKTNHGYVSLTSQDGSDIKMTTGKSGTNADVQALGFNVSNGADKLEGSTVDANTFTAKKDGVTGGETLTINGASIGSSVNGSLAAKVSAINSASSDSDVTADFRSEAKLDLGAAVQDKTNINGKKFEINGKEVALSNNYQTSTVATDASNNAIRKANAEQLIEDINGTEGLGVTATLDGNSVVLTAQDTGKEITLKDGDIGSAMNANVTGTAAGIDDLAAETKSALGSIQLTSTKGEDITIKGSEDGLKAFGLNEQGGDDTQVQSGLDVTSVSGSNDAIDRIDAALGKISEARADLGAKQNRLNSTINNNANVQQNLSAANSRIKDADFAKESSNLSRTQVLQQAGTSMLAQANQSTQSVLSLLG